MRAIIILFLAGCQGLHAPNTKYAEKLSPEFLKLHNQTGVKGDHMESIIGMRNAMNVSKVFHDYTNFVHDLNSWVIYGQWARYHLTYFTGDKPVPKVPGSADQSVLICTVSDFPSGLSKKVSGLINGSVTLVHYVNFKKDISVQGLLTSNNKTEVIFALNVDDLRIRNNSWVMNTFKIPPHYDNFTITLQPRSSSNATWSLGSITLNGTVPNKKTKPAIVPAVVPVTTPAHHVTTTPKPTTLAPTTTHPTLKSTPQPQPTPTKSAATANVKKDPLKDITGIATAIWDAFYVFLALFCACMIALIILIVRQR